MQRRPRSAFLIHTGYAAVLCLLGFAAFEVFRLHSASTSIRLQAYERFVEEDDAISSLRRDVWLAANVSRDYLLSANPERDRQFESQLRQIRTDSETNLALLERFDPGRTRETALRPKVLNYLRSLSTLSAAEQLREFVPLRTAALDAVESFTEQAQADVHRVLSTVAEERRRTTDRIFYLLCAVFVVALAVAVVTMRYAIRYERERQRFFDETARAKRELERLSASLLEVQEEERRSLARELHDELGQILTALRMELSHSLARSGDAPERARLERARALAETCVSTVRNISLMLRPALLDDLGLAAALQWQLQQLRLRSGIETHFAANDSGERLSDAVRTCVFRIAQEALNNCEKYAGAANVRVTLEISAAALSLLIEDDGRGFRSEGPHDGAGLLGIRERVGHLGGVCVFDTSTGGGARIAVTLPLEKEAPVIEVS